MKSFAAMLILIPFAFGCASKNSHAEKINLRKVNNIAVISVMDAPTTPLSNADQVITSEMLNSLKGSQKNSFALQVDNKIVQAEREQAVALKELYLGNRYQNLERYFLTQAASQNAEFLLVIHPAPHPQFSQYTPGYGLMCSPANGQSQIQGYFLMSSELWDVKKQEIVTRVQISPADLSFNTGKSCTGVAMTKDLTGTYKDDLMSLAKKSSSLILSRAGILN